MDINLPIQAMKLMPGHKWIHCRPTNCGEKKIGRGWTGNDANESTQSQTCSSNVVILSMVYLNWSWQSGPFGM